MLAQTSSARFSSPMTIIAPFSAPTDEPLTAQMGTPASRSARHAPIW